MNRYRKHSMPKFIPGLELKRLFYEEAIRPILDREFPQLRHSAARLGSGSEVLGYDTELSPITIGARVCSFF